MNQNNIMNAEQAAEYLGIGVSTLATWRSKNSDGKGPPYLKLGGRVAYTQEDLDGWVQSCRVEQGE